MTFAIRAVAVLEDEAALTTYCRLVSTITPDDPTSPEEVRWAEETYPGALRMLVEQDGEAIGAGVTGRIHMYEAGYERLWLWLGVLPEHRRRGAGTALYEALSAHAAGQGKTGFQCEVAEDQADAIAFLEHRGFEEVERDASVRLDLAGLPIPDPAPPPGVLLTTLAERPDLVAGAYAVAVRTFGDIPHADEPIDPGTFEEFRTRDVDRPGIPPDAFVVALDAATGEAIGYANLLLRADGKVGWHDMTATLPEWRGRGVAGALKRQTIGWAIRAGLEGLETGNDVANAPMREINRKLGYRPRPDRISFRGPLAPGVVPAP